MRHVLVIQVRIQREIDLPQRSIAADGRIVAEGTHAELLATEPRYAALMGDVPAEAVTR